MVIISTIVAVTGGLYLSGIIAKKLGFSSVYAAIKYYNNKIIDFAFVKLGKIRHKHKILVRANFNNVHIGKTAFIVREGLLPIVENSQIGIIYFFDEFSVTVKKNSEYIILPYSLVYI